MSSYNPQTHPNHPHAALPHRHAPPYNPAAAMQPSGAPAGTFLPGTKVQVGNHRVVVEKYLSEGGFAHVYVVRLPHPVDGSETAVLKRVAVPDKAALANMRTEVETMKKLKGHRHIVKYIDSHASQLKGGGYEVFLLMEFCSGGGLIDFMNTRLQNRLTEPEILKIFTDVAEGVACMHYLKPPLLHRDLKVENVLISLSGNSVSYKLCDFGSAAPPRPPAQSAAEGRLIEDDVQRHTTLQYRSPEMIDVYRKQPIDEKSDIWALGVLLYKLCYYTTPFEEVGQMAILNASFKYPAYPPFSDRLKLLIGAMLRENPEKRPNIYEVLREACHMRGKECPIRDIYAGRSVSEARRYQELPPSPTEPPKVGAVFSPPIQETQIIPEIAPMRRGRPSKPVSQPNSAKPSPSPFRGVSNDPFAALDGSKANVESDELSSRFPTLDQFSILHEKGGKFDFEPTVVETKPDADDLSQRITNALADEAFAKRASPSAAPNEPAGNRQPDDSPERKQKETQAPGLHEEPVRQQQPPLYQPVPQKPTMVSTGTMTSPSPPPPPGSSETKSSSSRPIYRFPPPGHEHRPSSQPWTTESERIPTGQGSIPSQTTPIFKHEPRPKPSSEKIAHLPVSSRPSLEASRPSNLDLDDPVARSKSANSKARPASVFVTSKVEHVRDPGSTRSSFESSRVQYEDGAPLQHSRTDTDRDYDRANISSDIDYLRAKEEEMSKKREKRMSGGPKHTKRSSLSSLSLSGTKTLLAGRFGDAFRRFEHNTHHESKSSRSPSPDDAHKRLTPITGSEVTDLSDDGRGGNDNEDDISPEMRRELERRRLSQEEKRVANAAAEYRRRLAERGEGNRGPEIPKAPAIQNKVQSLLQENNKPPPPKTATGYGRFTDSNVALQAKQFESRSEQQYTASVVSRNTGPAYGEEDRPKLPPRNNNNKELPGVPGGLLKQQTASGTLPPAVQRTGQQRPTAPPKPSNLRTGGQSETSATSGHGHGSSLPGTPTSPSEDWEASFSRRYPSLSGLELVETEIEIPRISSIRTKEV